MLAAASNPLTFTAGVPSGAPQVSSLMPPSGPIGVSVTIKGANFGAQPGKSSVTFDGKVVPVTKWLATSISTKVPLGATNGDFVVTVSGVASNAVTFTVWTAETPSSQGSHSASPPLVPGTYTLVPLFFVGTDPNNTYMPIEATDDQGKPLTLTIAAQAQAPQVNQDSGNGTTTIIRISESTYPQEEPGGSLVPASTKTTPHNL